MDNCSACGKSPISLWKWCQKLYWLRCSCDHCGVSLRADKKTQIAVLVLTILGSLTVFSALHFGLFQTLSQTIDNSIRELIGFAVFERALVLLCVFVLFISFFILGYFFLSGYKLTEKKKSKVESSNL